MLNDIQKHILEVVSGMAADSKGAVNIRADGKKAYRSNTPNVRIESKTDKEGIDIFVEPFTKADHVYIPVVVTEEGFHDTVYNDFYIGEGANVVINAGCGIHNCSGCDSEHEGIHTFHIGKNARVTYVEKHYGEGGGKGKNVMNPTTIAYLEEGAFLKMDTAQIKGIDDTKRDTTIVCGKGDGSRGRVISRSVAQERSQQIFYPKMTGNAACFGHVQCDSIIMDEAKISSIPAIVANSTDAERIHEAAIGKIAGDQLLKLETLGLTREEAEERILRGFLA